MKRIDEVAQRLDWNRERCDQIYQEILSEVVDPHKVSSLLRELELNSQRRVELHKQFSIECEKQQKPWWQRIFGP